MKILILGGSGFIGSYLRNAHLKLSDEVIVIDINTLRSIPETDKYTFLKEDLSNYTMEKSLKAVIKTFKPDFAYNCVAVATPSYYVKYPIETFNLDFEVNKRIIDILHKTKTSFIHFSTSEVYGKEWTEPYTEETNSIFGPANKQRWIYATSKLLLDQYIIGNNMDCCILRPFNFISHSMDWLPDINNVEHKTWIPRVPSCFLNALISNKSMQVVNPGTQQRCYTYIDDAIDGIISVINNWKVCSGEILNIGNPNNETTILDLASRMAYFFKEITGFNTQQIQFIDGECLYGKGYQDSVRRLFNGDKIKRLTGWEAKINLNETIKLTVLEGIKNFSSLPIYQI